jgi:hypothetical protein
MCHEKVNPSFLFTQIRKYNSTPRQIQKDAVLQAVGLHVGLLSKSKACLMPTLTPEERSLILGYLADFCERQGVIKVRFKNHSIE